MGKKKEKRKRSVPAVRGLKRKFSRRTIERKALEFSEIKKRIDEYLLRFKTADLNRTVGG